MLLQWISRWSLYRLEKKFAVVRRSDNVVERLNQVTHRLDNRFKELCDRAKVLAHGLSPEITTDGQAEFFSGIEVIEDHRVAPDSATDLWWLIVGLQYEGVPEDKYDTYLQLECDAQDLCSGLDTLLTLRKRLDPASCQKAKLRLVQ